MDAFHAEVLGCLAGLQAAIRLGIMRLNIEVDASLVKTALETNEFRLAPTGGVITEMKHIISTEFAHCNVLICRRNCNKVAHALAAAGCNLPSGCYNSNSSKGIQIRAPTLDLGALPYFYWPNKFIPLQQQP